MMSVWLPLRRAVILATIAGLSVMLWQQLTGVTDGGSATDRGIATALSSLPGSISSKQDATGSNEISARDLFVSITPPTPAAPSLVAPVAPAFTLIGTGIGPSSFALIRSNGNDANIRVERGMKVDGWDVFEIRKNNLILSRDNATWIMGFSPESARLCSSTEC